MKEYIDREKLIKELECGIRAGNYEDGYENYTHINDVDDCVDTVKYFDKADRRNRKDCKHNDEDTCYIDELGVRDDYFCSSGERKE